MVLSLLPSVDSKNRCFTTAGAPVTQTPCKLTRKLDLAFSNFSGCVLKLKYDQSDFDLDRDCEKIFIFLCSCDLTTKTSRTNIVTWSIKFGFPSLSNLLPSKSIKRKSYRIQEICQKRSLFVLKLHMWVFGLKKVLLEIFLHNLCELV